jgi:hypothetical protein
MHDETLVQRAIRLLSQPIEPVKEKEALGPQPAHNPIPTIAVGSLISWTRADGSAHTGMVDEIHVDETGTRWAFVTIGGSWAAVNCNFVKVVKA